MNRSTLIIVAAGFFFALLAAIAVQSLGGKGKKDDGATAQAPMIEVLVAAKDIGTGETFSAGSTQWSRWPEGSAFTGAIIRQGDQSALAAAEGRARRPITRGEPIMQSAIIKNKEANFVAAALTPGKRAVSVNVKADSSVAGFLSPGDHVDVIMTYDVKLPGDEKIRKAAVPVVTKMAAETILENLKVVAVDQQTEKPAEPKLVKTVTLEVDPRQAETIVLATKMGSLSLVLRALGDDTSVAHAAARPETTTDLRVSGVMREIMKGENKSGSLSQVVRVYTGTNVQNIEVRPYTSTQ